MLYHLICTLILVKAWSAQAWSCSAYVVGSAAEPLLFTERSLHCRPGSRETGNLTTLIHPALSSPGGSFSGITRNFTATQPTSQPALFVFEQADNVTLENSSLLDININGLGSLIAFVDSTNITIHNLTTYGGNAQHVLLSTNADADANSQFLVQSSVFSNSTSGAIYATYHNLTVRDTSFDRLIAPVNSSVPSVLHHDNRDGSLLTIHNCTFTNIQSYGKDMPVTVGVYCPNLMITGSSFINCSASSAIVNINSSALLDGTYLANETATVEDCSFVSCSASLGALYMMGNGSNPSQQLNLYNSIFIGNKGFYGGAVTLFAVGTVQVVACLFENNHAIWGLSAFYVYGWDQQVTFFIMRDSVFLSNNGTRLALADPDQYGITDNTECGGLYLSSCKCIGIANSTFQGNVGIGLCVHGQLGSSPACSNSDPVFFNQGTIAGPAAEPFLDEFLDRYDDLVITVDIRGSQFSDNTDAFLTRTSAEPVEVQPIDYLSGGAGLSIQEVLFTVLSSNTFSSNLGRQGSAVHLDTCLATYVFNTTFDNNTATGQGGSVALVNSHSKGLLLANSTFTNSQALFGGAIYGDVSAAITISNSRLMSNQAVTDGGAVFCDNCQQLNLDLQTELSCNVAGGSGGAVFCDGCVLMTAHAVMMTNNSAGANGGAMAISGNGFTLTNVSHSTFGSNTASNTGQTDMSPSSEATAVGGAVSVAGGVSLFNQNNFSNNTAAGYGGALAYEDDCFTVINTAEALSFLWAQLAPELASLAGTCSYFISTANTFTGNHANIGGAVMYSTNVTSMQLCCTADLDPQSPSTDCLQWNSNSLPANTVGAEGAAGYGPGLAFPPAEIVFGGTTRTSQQISYISDGSTKVPMPTVNVLDQAGHKFIAQPLRVNVTVNTVSTLADGMGFPQLPGQTQASGDVNGDIDIADLVLIAAPGTYDLLVALPDFSQVPAATVQVTVQPCGLGQVPSSDDSQCTLCPSSTYSFDPLVDDCKPCPSQATCMGGATLVPQQQFWHSAPDSDHIITCPNNNACAGSTAALLACQNATYQGSLDVTQAVSAATPECSLSEDWSSSDPRSYMRQLCAPGYYGPVCSLCVTSGNQTYGRVGTLQCKPCRRPISIIAAYVASALLVLAWLSYTIHVTLIENEEATAGHEEPQRTSQLIRALNLWLQYISLLGGINIPAPKTVHWIFSAAQFAFATVTSGSLSTDCLLSGPINNALQRILIQLAVPVLMFISLSGIQTLRWWRNNKKPAAMPMQHHSSSAELRRRLLITLLEVLFYYFPSLLTTTLSLFACFHLDPVGPANAQYHNAQAEWPHGYWLPDMTVQCFTGWHQRLAIILGTPLITLTWVIIPTLPAMLLFMHRRNLNAPGIQLQLGYIYRDYRPELWFWNSVVLFLTLALAASQVFAMALDAYFQLAIMLMIMTMGVTAFAHFRPFVDDLLQRMQVLGLFIVQTTAAGCLYFLDPTSIANTTGLEAVGIVLLVLNVAYVLVMLVMIAAFGADKTKHFTCTAFAVVKTSSLKFRHSLSGASSSGIVPESRERVQE